jgi:preprotein translocase subunit SecB
MADEPAQATSTDKQLLLQKIYIKDMSFESPKAPEIFGRNAQATTNLNIGSKNRKLDEDHVEVSLTLTIETKAGDETLFLIEVVQAGIFTLKNYEDQERQILLGTFCPGTLYPFAREAVAEIASKGGFPQLLLQPINFDAVYAQAVQQNAAQQQQPPIQVTEVTTNSNGSEKGGETH